MQWGATTDSDSDCDLSAALSDAKGSPKNGSLLTEEDWNEVSTIESEPYRYSKVCHKSSLNIHQLDQCCYLPLARLALQHLVSKR